MHGSFLGSKDEKCKIYHITHQVLMGLEVLDKQNILIVAHDMKTVVDIHQVLMGLVLAAYTQYGS